MSIQQAGDTLVISPIAQPGDAGPSTRAESVLGGFVALPSGSGPPTTSNVPASSRRIGMLAFTPGDSKFWQLLGGVADVNWTLASFGASDIAPVDLATTGNITLSGEQTIDGTLTSSSRVLVWQQTTASQNGIYTSGSGAWVRTTDQDSTTDFRPGVFFLVKGGTDNLNALAALDGQAPATVGTSSVAYALTSPLPGSYAVDDITARNAIPQRVRRQGLKAHLNDGTEYVLGAGLTNSDWQFVNYASPFTTLAVIGAGFDGNVTISSGVTTLTRDMFYNNLTVSGTGQLNTAGYRVFVAGILDLTSAPAGAIVNNGTNGNNAVADVAGALAAGAPFNSLGGSLASTVGASGGTGVGSQASIPTQQICNGGAAGASGVAGAGSSGSGGNFRSSVSPSSPTPTYRWQADFFRVNSSGVSPLSGGCTGPSGSSGAGDGTNKGGGGASAGTGAGHLFLSVNTLNRSASTAVGAIQSKGGNGANGGTAASGNSGGGSGSPGGGGGWIYIFYVALNGASATNMIDGSGGNGGNGGNGVGTGIGGQGGQGGASGRITLGNLTTGVITESGPGSLPSSPSVPGTSTGSSGTSGTTLQVSL